MQIRSVLLDLIVFNVDGCCTRSVPVSIVIMFNFISLDDLALEPIFLPFLLMDFGTSFGFNEKAFAFGFDANAMDKVIREDT